MESLLRKDNTESLIDKELVDYFDMSTQLYQWNYYASAWHLLLFAISCISGSDNWAWRVTLAIFAGVYISNILFRKCLYGEEDEHLCGIPKTYVFLGVLFVSFGLAGICGIILAAGFNNPNILPIALSTSHSGTSLTNTAFNNATCKNIVRSDFRDWMDCLGNLYECKTDACVAYNVDPDAYEILGNTTDIQFVLRKGTTDVFSDGMYVWWGVSLFCIITSLFHMILAISADDVADTIIHGSGYDMTTGIWPVEKERDNKQDRQQRIYPMPETKWWISVPYTRWVWNGIQPMRWAEYSITASLMMVLVFIINGVTDIYLLAFSYIIMNLINSFGAAIDYVSEQAIVAWFWACGVGAIVWQFALLLAAYSENISPYMEADTKDLWQEYFGFIPVMNWLVIITFSGFGITNIVHQYMRFHGCCKCTGYIESREANWRKKCCCCVTNDIASKEEQRELMHEFELYYIAQSFISKTILVACVLYGSVQRL
jgi:hypothetical protein